MGSTVSIIERDLKTVCNRINSCILDTQVDFGMYIREQGLDCDFTTQNEMVEFYRYDRSVMFFRMVQIELKGDVDVTEEQREHFRVLGDKYLKKLNIFEEQIDMMTEPFKEDLEQVIEYTIADEPFRQEKTKENTILYIQNHRYTSMARMEVNFRNGDVLGPVDSGIENNKMHSRNTRKRMRQEAGKKDANIYVISHPKKEMPFEVMMMYAMYTMRNRYERQNPGKAKSMDEIQQLIHNHLLSIQICEEKMDENAGVVN